MFNVLTLGAIYIKLRYAYKKNFIIIVMFTACSNPIFSGKARQFSQY